LNETVTLLLWAVAVVLLTPTVVFCAECLLAVVRRERSRGTGRGTGAEANTAIARPRVAVLTPAHNEQQTLATTLDALRPQLRGGDSVTVVADNCDDATATIARERGANVAERCDAERLGKGYALAAGLAAIPPESFDVLVIVDADCTVEPGAIDALAAQVAATGKPAQAVYLMETCERPTPRDQVSSWAFMVKNLVRPLGLASLKLPVQLTGTGMAFPRATIAGASVDGGNIVEDMQLGLDLALAGSAPQLCPDARVTGRFPKAADIALGQRRRWEHGHLRTILGQVPRLLWLGVTRGRLGAVAMALDLLVPPLSLLLVLLIVASLASATIALLTPVTWMPSILLSWGTLAVLGCVFLAWLKFGRRTLPAGSLLAAMSYVAWKIPMYCMFVISPEKKWIRTARTPTDTTPLAADPVESAA
jgi:cellulose synthase/poly-beta-1,6-N-acetylglucosamine synthase-like glycosyltransferase